MTTAAPTSTRSVRRSAAAGFLSLLLPGAGQLVLGRGRPALIFFVPVLLLGMAALGTYAGGGFTALVAFAVTPGVLPALAILNVALAVWRIAAGYEATRGAGRRSIAAAILGPAALLLVLAPHIWLGSTIAATDDFLNATFASGPEATEEPFETPPPDWTFDPGPIDEETPAPLTSPDPSATPGPTPTRRPTGPLTSGTGSLPGLNVSVPWQRPGAEPWGNDGRFDLLLLGSDAGRDRWSRRMDVMLLVEIDVATGKVAMIGIPRNLQNAPLPAGPARDAVACGCYKPLLNGLYVEATIFHPERWPGSGAVAGIGAVRSVVSELTGRPIDAVLVADLWGVIKVVDAMGGIDIDVPSGVYDANYPDPVMGRIEIHIPAGQQHLNGRMALAYARSRHQDSDYGRMARQQTLLLAIRDQIGPETILNAPDLFAAAKGFTWTDLPRSSLPNLVNLFGKAAHANVKHLRIVPPTFQPWLTTSAITKIQVAIAKLLGVAPPPTPPPTAPPSIAPSPSPSVAPSHSPPPPTDAPPTGSPPPPTESPTP